MFFVQKKKVDFGYRTTFDFGHVQPIHLVRVKDQTMHCNQLKIC